jgi:hypothetical protein
MDNDEAPSIETIEKIRDWAACVAQDARLVQVFFRHTDHPLHKHAHAIWGAADKLHKDMLWFAAKRMAIEDLSAIGKGLDEPTVEDTGME